MQMGGKTGMQNKTSICPVKGFQMSHCMARMSNYRKTKMTASMNVILILLKTFGTLK